MFWVTDAQLQAAGQAGDDVGVWIVGALVLAVFAALVWSVIKRNRLK